MRSTGLLSWLAVLALSNGAAIAPRRDGWEDPRHVRHQLRVRQQPETNGSPQDPSPALNPEPAITVPAAVPQPPTSATWAATSTVATPTSSASSSSTASTVPCRPRRRRRTDDEDDEDDEDDCEPELLLEPSASAPAPASTSLPPTTSSTPVPSATSAPPYTIPAPVPTKTTGLPVMATMPGKPIWLLDPTGYHKVFEGDKLGSVNYFATSDSASDGVSDNIPQWCFDKCNAEDQCKSVFIYRVLLTNGFTWQENFHCDRFTLLWGEDYLNKNVAGNDAGVAFVKASAM
ncbi:hypothetical protein LX32DRAFT_149055 [Colletotrichum zoysiae]|uniref:Apple domain-containing protein n=1 Tax=Colletotrichum zoysiae TaxID=1216348 RepID=A0AAD9H6S8_9PEZI|nr:hypothetical protein LX32DRAFT_149055 [Colletotrichum zoysiae]